MIPEILASAAILVGAAMVGFAIGAALSSLFLVLFLDARFHWKSKIVTIELPRYKRPIHLIERTNMRSGKLVFEYQLVSRFALLPLVWMSVGPWQAYDQPCGGCVSAHDL